MLSWKIIIAEVSQLKTTTEIEMHILVDRNLLDDAAQTTIHLFSAKNMDTTSPISLTIGASTIAVELPPTLEAIMRAIFAEVFKHLRDDIINVDKKIEAYAASVSSAVGSVIATVEKDIAAIETVKTSA